MEILVVMAIMTLLSGTVSVLLTSGFRYQRNIWDEVSSQVDGRKTMERMTEDIRKAEEGSTGGYPIATATSSECIFYANIDDDLYKERVRYTYATSTRTLTRGILKPSGTPLTYTASNEKTEIIAHDVVNASVNHPVFRYYGEGAVSSTAPLSPVVITNIRVVQIQLDIEKDATQSPVPFHVESMVHIRSLKSN